MGAPPMDRQYIENEQIVERYLSGDLTVREAREFQRFCSANPELLDAWPIPAGLRAQLTHQARPADKDDAEMTTDEVDVEPGNTAIYADVRSTEALPPLRWTAAWRRSPILLPGLAMALLLAVAGLIGVALNARNLNAQLRSVTREKQASELQAHSTVQTQRIKLVRGRPQRPTLSVGWPMPPQLLDLYIDVTEGNYTSFQVTIDRVDGTRVLQIRRIARDSNRELRLSLNSSAFGPGEYLMKFDGYTWRGEPQELGWIMLGLQ